MDEPQKSGSATGDSATAPHWFATTHWSVVMLAGDTNSPKAISALERLCRTYWLPLYSYVRRQGYGPHDAQDLTQGFFVRLLRLNSFAQVSQAKGKFRTFLLASLNHYLSDERDRARAEKRGQGQAIISLDETEAEQRYLQVPSAGVAPEAAFDRGWALTVMEEALKELRDSYITSGKQDLFEHLSAFLSTEGDARQYEALAAKLGMSTGSLPVAVHRLRQRYRECVRLALAQTVASPEDLEEEMNYLFSVLGGSAK
jgi:RNA polymerase sigma-70 factor (ECF subfamily)